MVTARIQNFCPATQLGSVRTDRIAPSSHGLALGLITARASQWFRLGPYRAGAPAEGELSGTFLKYETLTKMYPWGAAGYAVLIWPRHGTRYCAWIDRVPALVAPQSSLRPDHKAPLRRGFSLDASSPLAAVSWRLVESRPCKRASAGSATNFPRPTCAAMCQKAYSPCSRGRDLTAIYFAEMSRAPNRHVLLSRCVIRVDGDAVETVVALLMLKCSSTGREFSTGIHTDEDSLRRLPDTVTKIACPHCGMLHSWRPHEAWLADVILPPTESSAFSRAP
jgi:hypothetical protein